MSTGLRDENEARAGPGDSHDTPWLSNRVGGELSYGEAVNSSGTKKGLSPLGLVLVG
jgi:hypothetical protein